MFGILTITVYFYPVAQTFVFSIGNLYFYQGNSHLTRKKPPKTNIHLSQNVNHINKSKLQTM